MINKNSDTTTTADQTNLRKKQDNKNVIMTIVSVKTRDKQYLKD